MNTIGETVKLLRKQKKLTQKSVYDGIVSRNFASRFEHGRSNIETSKFLLILKRLDISPNEFQFIYERSADASLQQIVQEIDQASVLKDYDKLQRFYDRYRIDSTLNGQVIAAMAYVKIYVHGHNLFKMSLQPTYHLRVHLMESPSWSLFELRSFVDGIFIFRQDQKALALCLAKAIAAFNKYLELIEFRAEVEQSMASILLNDLQIQLVANSQDFSTAYQKLIKTLAPKMTDFTAKLSIRFSQLLFNLYFQNDIDQVNLEAQSFLKSLDHLRFPESSVFKAIYNYHLPICTDRELKK